MISLGMATLHKSCSMLKYNICGGWGGGGEPAEPIVCENIILRRILEFSVQSSPF